jgi:hypothetical protein
MSDLLIKIHQHLLDHSTLAPGAIDSLVEHYESNPALIAQLNERQGTHAQWMLINGKLIIALEEEACA